MSRRHVVADGECLSSIAFAYGFAPETIWSDPANDQLRRDRKSFNLLAPGDGVMVPERSLREERCATGKRHCFKRKAVPEKFRVRILEEDRPRAGVPYRLTIDGQKLSGKTDGDGWIEQFIPPDAHYGRLVLVDEETGEERLGDEIMEFELGRMAPLDTERGARDRLVSLGYLDAGDEDPASLVDAIQRFQIRHQLARSGRFDDDTRAALEKAYGA